MKLISTVFFIRFQNENDLHAHETTEKYSRPQGRLQENLNNTLSEMNHTMKGFKSRLDEVEETLNEIQIREQEYKGAEAQREKKISRNEGILRELCDQSKENNIHILGVPEEEEERDKEGQKVL